MSGWSNIDRPSDPRKAEGDCSEPQRGQDGPDVYRPQRPIPHTGLTPAVSGLILCVLGSVMASSAMTVFAALFVGYGYALCKRMGSFRQRLLAVVLSVAPVLVLSVGQDLAIVAGSVVVCLFSVVIAHVFLDGKMTAGMSCLLVGLLALSHLAADSALAASQGTSLNTVMSQLMTTVQQDLGSGSIAELAQMQAMSGLVELLWPSSYVVTGLLEFLFVRFGARLAVNRVGAEKTGSVSLVDFDLPLWVVAVFVVAIAGVALELSLPQGSHVVLMVATNLLVSVRFAFAVQGLDLLVWFFRHRGIRGILPVLVGFLALYLEMQFFVLTVVGLVDVWANFRHLDRGGHQVHEGPAVQD